MTKFEGDNHISSFDLRLWQLVQHVLFKWHTLVIFKWDMYDVPKGKMGFLRFFVPGNSTYAYEIVEFLKHETETIKMEPCDMGFDTRHPGVEVEVSTSVDLFKGLRWYLERDEVEKIAGEAMKTLTQMLKKRQDENIS
jgi:hypothetical protein